MKYVRLWNCRPQIEAMVGEGLSLSEMARRLGTNKRHVKGFLEEAGIPHERYRQAGANNPAWKGGRMVDKDGYVLVYQPEHPYATRHGYVREHRLVMEAHLGRYLLPTEVVHHRRAPKTDNRLENLKLFPSNGRHIAETTSGMPHNMSAESRAILSASARARAATRQPPSAEARWKMGWRRGTARVRRPYTMTEEEKDRRRALLTQIRERKRAASQQESAGDDRAS